MKQSDNLAAARLAGFSGATLVMGKCFTANPYDSNQDGRHFTLMDYRDRHLVVEVLAYEHSIGFIGTSDKKRWFVLGYNKETGKWPALFNFDYGDGGHDSHLEAVIAAVSMVTGTQE